MVTIAVELGNPLTSVAAVMKRRHESAELASDAAHSDCQKRDNKVLEEMMGSVYQVLLLQNCKQKNVHMRYETSRLGSKLQLLNSIVYQRLNVVLCQVVYVGDHI